MLAEEQATSKQNTEPEPNAIQRGPDDISTRIKADTRPKEVTFDFPGIDKFFKPWDDWKTRIAEEHNFRLGFDYQPAIQWSNNSIGNDSAAGGIPGFEVEAQKSELDPSSSTAIAAVPASITLLCSR